MTGRAAYLQIADELRSKIEDGTLEAGASLPSQSQLMTDFGVSNTVAKAAIRVLRSEGLVVGQPGKGVFVRDVAGEPVGSEDFTAVMRKLAVMSDQLQSIATRVADLEAAMETGDQPAPPTRQSATRARKADRPSR